MGDGTGSSMKEDSGIGAGGGAGDKPVGNSEGNGPWEDVASLVRRLRDGEVKGGGKLGGGKLELGVGRKPAHERGSYVQRVN